MNIVKLQVALDTFSPERILSYLREAGAYMDIVELGTPFVLKYGVEIIPRIREAAPGVEILCDAKIMDAGYFEAKELFESGADYVTVLAVTEHSTLKDCVRAAGETGGKVVADMICVQDIPQKVKELDEIGLDVIAVHTGVDEQAMGRTPLNDLKKLKELGTKAVTAVAGGIRDDTLAEYMALDPGIIIVGGGILNAASPAEETKKMYLRIHGDCS